METKHFGFQKVQDGAMVFGKDLNKVLESIDDKLYQALGKMTEAGAAVGAVMGSAVYTQDVFDDEKEIIFATPVKLMAARLVFVNGTMGANIALVALALASAPTTPITTPVEATGASGDMVMPVPVPVDVPADEEIILIQKDKADVGFVAAADVQVVVEVQKVTT